MEKDNGASVLGTSSRTAVFRSWCGIFLRGVPAALSWAIILYVAFGIFSKVHAANVFTGQCQLYNNYGNALIAAQSMDSYLGQVNCNGSTQSCTHVYATQGFQSGCPGWDTDAGYPSSQEYAQVQVGYTLDHYDSGTSTFYYDILLAFRANGDVCPEGTAADENGACIQSNECEASYLDDTTFSQTLDTNPGLCSVGDYVAFNDANVCTYSESSNAYCEATHYGTVTYQAALPDLITESGGITFTENTCGGAGTVDGYEFPASCDPPPPNCPPGTYSDGVTCSAYDDTDNETPPDPATAERTRTETTTTSTVDNGDGTTTTTSTTTTTYGDCPPGETCTDGFDYEGPGDREAKTFQETFEAYLADIDNAPIFQVADGIASAVPESATCPEFPIPEIALVGQSYTIDGHCLIADEYESEIRTVMALVWGLLGLMILLSA